MIGPATVARLAPLAVLAPDAVLSAAPHSLQWRADSGLGVAQLRQIMAPRWPGARLGCVRELAERTQGL